MRIQSFFTFLLLLGTCAAQEITGPDSTTPGMLASFEIAPAQEAAWHIVTPSLGMEPHMIDTGQSKLYFASPERGRFTIVAGIVDEGTPRLLVKTFINGEENGLSVPALPVSSLEAWIKTQLPILVKSKNLASESRLVGECFEQIVRRIDEGNIRTAQNAGAQLQIALTAALAQASPTAVTDWIPFLTELSRQIETEIAGKTGNLTEMKAVFESVGYAMKSLELPDGNSTPLRKTVNPNTRRTQIGALRNLLSL